MITTHGYRVAKLGTKDEKEASECANRVGGAVAAALECRFRKTGLEATRAWTVGRGRAKGKDGSHVHVAQCDNYWSFVSITRPIICAPQVL